MIAWVLKRSSEYDEDKDKDIEDTVLHAYRKVKRPQKGVLPKTLCTMSIHWGTNVEDDSMSFSPAFPPTDTDKVCKVCKEKAEKAVKAT